MNAIYNADTDYEYCFNGMEREKPFDDKGNTYDLGARISNTEYGGRFLSRDPLEYEFPNQSSYIFAGNNPLLNIDIEGKFGAKVHEDMTKDYLGSITGIQKLRLVI